MRNKKNALKFLAFFLLMSSVGARASFLFSAPYIEKVFEKCEELLRYDADVSDEKGARPYVKWKSTNKVYEMTQNIQELMKVVGLNDDRKPNEIDLLKTVDELSKKVDCESNRGNRRFTTLGKIVDGLAGDNLKARVATANKYLKLFPKLTTKVTNLENTVKKQGNQIAELQINMKLMLGTKYLGKKVFDSSVQEKITFGIFKGEEKN